MFCTLELFCKFESFCNFDLFCKFVRDYKVCTNSSDSGNFDLTVSRDRCVVITGNLTPHSSKIKCKRGWIILWSSRAKLGSTWKTKIKQNLWGLNNIIRITIRLLLSFSKLLVTRTLKFKHQEIWFGILPHKLILMKQLDVVSMRKETSKLALWRTRIKLRLYKIHIQTVLTTYTYTYIYKFIREFYNQIPFTVEFILVISNILRSKVKSLCLI